MVVLRVTCPVQLLILFMTLFGILMIRLSFCLVLGWDNLQILATLSLHQLYGSRPVILHKARAGYIGWMQDNGISTGIDGSPLFSIVEIFFDLKLVCGIVYLVFS
ncbi:hypothetical protein BC941DRAFT_443706 [Chlamydoabsidia padenii]|nr:hypothetical protein BC941DRAFT_443706 [Chlamydoabsidia padenii]